MVIRNRSCVACVRRSLLRMAAPVICEACDHDDECLMCEGCGCCQCCCNCTDTDCDCAACIDRRNMDKDTELPVNEVIGHPMKAEIRSKDGLIVLRYVEIENIEVPTVIVLAKRFFALGEVAGEIPTEPYVYVEVSGVVLASKEDLSSAPAPVKHAAGCATNMGRLYICDCWASRKKPS